MPPILVAHLSDLHFGAANSDECWDNLKDYLNGQVHPSLVLVTGDLVDTPRRALFMKAKARLDQLDARYYVCPGNHDRHPRGNRLGRWVASLLGMTDSPAVFFEVFNDHLVNPTSFKEPKTPELATPGLAAAAHAAGQWHPKIGILGLDSSRSADFCARGYVDRNDIEKVRKAMEEGGADKDLVILLVHHHLQSVRNLEEKKHGQPTSLADLTCMVNAGCLLEQLAKSHVDLVLHGHEHCSYWARYGSLESGRGEVFLLGAASATGNGSLDGCLPSRASFNLITLSENGSTRFCEVRYTGSEWKSDRELPLLYLRQSRRLRLLRRIGDSENELNTRIVKLVEFTDANDIRVNWILKNRILADRSFSFEATNSTGEPCLPSLTLTDKSGRVTIVDVSDPGFAEDQKKDSTWCLKTEIDETFVGTPLTIELSYQWKGGAILRAEQFEQVGKGKAGRVRKKGFEFASVSIGIPVEFSELIVIVPSDAIADQQTPQLMVWDADGTEYPQEARDLQESVIKLGPGRFSITIPYPRENWCYALAWRPARKLNRVA